MKFILSTLICLTVIIVECFFNKESNITSYIVGYITAYIVGAINLF